MCLALFYNSRISIRKSHKKREDCFKTRAELAILRTYVESQAILDSILLYRISKSKPTKI